MSRVLRTLLFLAGPFMMNLAVLMLGLHVGAMAGANGAVFTREYFGWMTWILIAALGGYAQTIWMAWRVSQRQWDE